MCLCVCVCINMPKHIFFHLILMLTLQNLFHHHILDEQMEEYSTSVMPYSFIILVTNSYFLQLKIQLT